jgi:signal transduction histidine kinase
VMPVVRIHADDDAGTEPDSGRPDTRFVRIWIEDNGIGISDKERERIFRMFERIHPAAKFDGTGIGLTIARKAAQRMGGNIGFESNTGSGSRFWIDIQKAEKPADTAGIPAR